MFTSARRKAMLSLTNLGSSYASATIYLAGLLFICSWSSPQHVSYLLSSLSPWQNYMHVHYIYIYIYTHTLYIYIYTHTYTHIQYYMCCPGGGSGKEPNCQCRRYGFNPWVWKIPWKREWLSTPVILPGKSHGQTSQMGYSPQGHKESEYI